MFLGFYASFRYIILSCFMLWARCLFSFCILLHFLQDLFSFFFQFVLDVGSALASFDSELNNSEIFCGFKNLFALYLNSRICLITLQFTVFSLIHKFAGQNEKQKNVHKNILKTFVEMINASTTSRRLPLRRLHLEDLRWGGHRHQTEREEPNFG